MAVIQWNVSRLVLVAAGGLLAATAHAQEPQVERGRAIAQTWCASCHAIGEGTQGSALVGAPSFRSLGASGAYDTEALASALLLPHPVMPEMPVTEADLRAIAAYLSWIAEEERSEAPVDDGAVVAGSAAITPVEKGRAIVEAACADCHAVEGAGPSPVAVAPPFSTLSRNYPVAHLAEALAEGILVGHPEVEMPEFVFEPDEVGAIIAFLETVQEPR